MVNVKRMVLIAGGGAIAGVALLGGIAMAQTPTPTTPNAPDSPAPTAPANPDTPVQPSAPRQRGGDDCPEKGTSSGSQSTQAAGTMTGVRF